MRSESGWSRWRIRTPLVQSYLSRVEIFTPISKTTFKTVLYNTSRETKELHWHFKVISSFPRLTDVCMRVQKKHMCVFVHFNSKNGYKFMKTKKNKEQDSKGKKKIMGYLPQLCSQLSACSDQRRRLMCKKTQTAQSLVGQRNVSITGWDTSVCDITNNICTITAQTTLHEQ